MNDQIKLLAVQAWRATADEVAYLNRIHNRSISQDEVTDIFEIKFAELIVRDCIRLCDQVDIVGADDCISNIKEHFGVEE